ncbi:hypothetical protein [Streptacidiphilus sp. MAP5-3]|uniref:hypothetical protein n=1 Tax=unclassified Streptacidiphilus TaxID=2643834 RepID=UPI003513D8DD
MSRVWIEDRISHAAYKEAVKNAKSSGRKLPGRFRVRWYDPNGKERALTFLKKIDAEAKRTELESKLGDGTHKDPAAGRTKMADVAEAWLACKVDLRRSTRSRYKGVLDFHILPRWGTTSVARVSHEDIMKWLAALMEDSIKAEKPFSATTIRKIYVVLKGVLGYAVRTNKIGTNPAIGVPLPGTPLPKTSTSTTSRWKRSPTPAAPIGP